MQSNVPIFEGLTLASLSIGFIISSYSNLKNDKKPVNKQAKTRNIKQSYRQSSLKAARHFKFPNPDKKYQILNLNASEIHQGIINGEFSCEDVILSFISRTLERNKAFNMITEDCFKEALNKARYYDQMLKHGLPLPPLAGIPVSVKDNIIQQGKECTIGLTSNAFRVQARDGIILEILQQLGAIPLFRGTTGFAGISYEAQTDLWGTTYNSWNPDRIGGSGDVVGVSSCSVPIAISTDLNGDMRFAALANGVVAFTPTRKRLTQFGILGVEQVVGISENTMFSPLFSPAGRYVEDLALILRHFWEKVLFKLDPLASHMPFNDEEFNSNRPLTIGVVYNAFPELPNHVKHSISLAEWKLDSRGHKVIKCNLPEIPATQLFYALLMSNGLIDNIQELSSQDSLPPDLKKLIEYHKLSDIAKFLKKTYCRLKNDKYTLALYQSLEECDTYEYLRRASAIKSFKRTLVNWWKDQGLDAIIIPGLPTLPLTPQSNYKLHPLLDHLLISTLFDLPTGVMPLYALSKEDVRNVPLYSNKLLSEGLNGASNMPVGVQVVSLTHRDETCLRVMMDLQVELPFWEKFKLEFN